MAKVSRSDVIETEAQLAALASPLRVDIVDTLGGIGASSAAELAAILGRPADALYYHLKILKRAGLVVDAGPRSGKGRPEAMFAAVSPDVRIDSETVRRRDKRALVAIVESMLRLGARDYGRALADDSVVLSGPQRDLLAHRKTVWMTPQDLRAFHETLPPLVSSPAAKAGDGRLYAVTILLTPLGGRRSRVKSKKAPTP